MTLTVSNVPLQPTVAISYSGAMATVSADEHAPVYSGGAEEACARPATHSPLRRGGPAGWLRLVVGAVLLAVALADCSSDNPSESLAASTTSPSSTTDGVAMTEPAAPESESTESPTTTAMVDPPPTTTIAQAAPTSPPTDEASIAERIRGYFDAREVANAAPSPDPEHPLLAVFATGSELANVIAETTARRDDGRAIRPGEQTLANVRVGSVVVGDSTASAAACSIDDGVVFDLASDEIIDDSVLTHNYTIELALVDGAWKVSRIVRLQQWEGVAGCALAESDYPY